jgi:hypothetical protein
MQNLPKKVVPEHHAFLWSKYANAYTSTVKNFIEFLNAQHRTSMPECLYEFHKLRIENVEVPKDMAKVTKWMDRFFEANNICPIRFYCTAVIVANQALPKLNCLVLKGPVNTFKSTMIRTILDGTSHVPMTRTQNSNQFYLQSCLSVDYIIWEEPTIVPANVNEWKLLLEGAPVQVSVKNSQDEMLQRTPFFITTNNALGYWLSTVAVQLFPVTANERLNAISIGVVYQTLDWFVKA